MAVVGLLGSFLLLLLSLFSLYESGWFALAAPLWLAMLIYWGYTVATLPRWVRFEAHELVIGTWRQTIRLPYTTIEEARLSPLRLQIITPSQRVSLARLDAYLLARIYVILEETAPQLVAKSQQRFQSLPIQITGRWLTPILYFLFGGMMTLIGIGLLASFIAPEGSSQTVNLLSVESIALLLVAVVTLALGLGYSYIALFRYVWQYTFTTDSIAIRYSLYRRTWAATTIHSVDVKHFERVYKGTKQLLVYIEIGFADGQRLRISPETWNVAMGFSDAVTVELLIQLAERLRTLYSLN